jgi:hypothetical protein
MKTGLWVAVVAGLLLALVCGCLNLGGGTQITWAPRASLAKDVVGTSLAATQADAGALAQPGEQNPNAASAAFRRSTDTGMSGDQGVSAVKTSAPTDSSGEKSLDKSMELSLPLGGVGAGVAGATGTLAGEAVKALTAPTAQEASTAVPPKP